MGKLGIKTVYPQVGSLRLKEYQRTDPKSERVSIQQHNGCVTERVCIRAGRGECDCQNLGMNDLEVGNGGFVGTEVVATTSA
ncbi:hypothetical protein J6590_039987 [Homalodisca vitripennis]|nr:hypothetical protein J6590_039987 [Homalodisca vitripennis]